MAVVKTNALQMPDGNIYQFTGLLIYGTCTTAATEQTKVIDLQGASLPRDLYGAIQDGAEILVYFSHPQRYDGPVELFIDGSSVGSKQVYYEYSIQRVGNGAWNSGLVRFTYWHNAWYMTRRDYITLADLPVWNGSVT